MSFFAAFEVFAHRGPRLLAVHQELDVVVVDERAADLTRTTGAEDRWTRRNTGGT